jgi:putative tricarboxylic transport membrane protein
MDGLLHGIAVATQWGNLLSCLIGVFVGTLIGVLPGVGPTATISMLLPLTIGLDPVSAIITIAGIYYGAQYGGSTTAILVNIPGEASSVITCLDGYQMAQQGRAGVAIGIAAIGSFIAGTLGAFGIALVSEPLVSFALRFGPPEYFMLMLLGFAVLLVLSRGSFSKSMIMISLGLFLGMVGQDVVTGEERFTFGLLELTDGISIVTLTMGLFGLSEVLLNLEQLAQRSITRLPIGRLLPNLEDWRQSRGAIARGSVLGFFIGVLPGGGAALASFISYTLEKHLSREPERFGRGAIEGVAGPESANNAGAAGSFIPLLTLGLPGNPATAILLGGFILYGVTPGPLLVQNHPEVFWGVIASMYVGNILLLLLNLPLVGVWVRLLRVPYRWLFPLLILFMIIGSYSVARSSFDLTLLLAFGLLGYLLKKLDFDATPLVLAFVLGDKIEVSLRQSLMMGHGSPAILVDRPIALALLVLVLIVAALPLLGAAGDLLRTAKAVNAPDE